MNLPASPETLTAQRAERIAELEMLGLAVNIIEPEIFGDGIIEVKGFEALNESNHPNYLSWDLSSVSADDLDLSDLGPPFINPQFDIRVWQRKLDRILQQYWSDFDAVIIRKSSHLISQCQNAFEQIGQPIGTQFPHRDANQSQGFIALHFAGKKPRIPKTFLMTERAINDFLSANVAQARLRTSLATGLEDFGIALGESFHATKHLLKKYDRGDFADYPEGSQHLFWQRFTTEQVIQGESFPEFIDCFDRYLVEYNPGDTVVINQSGPLRLRHGQYLPTGTDPEETDSRELLRALPVILEN